MTHGFRPYSKYKDSKGNRLAVPEHWQLARVKNLFRERDVRSGTGGGVLLSLTRARGLLPQSEASKRLASTEDLSKYRVCDPSNLVMNRMQAWSGMFAIADTQGVVSPDYSVFTSISPLEGKYFEYLFKSPCLVDQFAQRSKGIGSGFNRLYSCDFGAVPIAFPDVEEQSTIVRFLGYADRRIRRYIRAKQKLIKLLEEQKQAVIHHAVTRGLDPNVRLKPSGVEWLGDVPGHWRELPLKRIAKFDNSGSYGIEPEESECVMPVATTAQIDRDGHFNVVRMPRRGFSWQDVEKYGCRPGDILVVKSSGSIFNVISGKAGIIRANTPAFVFSNFLMRVMPDRDAVDPEYLFLLLSGHLTRERVKRMVSGTTYPNLRVGEYNSALLPLPPLDEQRHIVRAMLDASATFDRAAETASREIALLREYRTRLIADVVTGKLDVREAAAGLPDEDEEPEELALADETLAGCDESELNPDELAEEEVVA
jgi:type I restriction enzyme S subunit